MHSGSVRVRTGIVERNESVEGRCDGGMVEGGNVGSMDTNSADILAQAYFGSRRCVSKEELCVFSFCFDCA